MYYLVFLAVLALLIYSAKFLGETFAALVIIIYCVCGLTVGLLLPEVYNVSEDGTVKRQYGSIPWIKHSVDSLEIRLHLDETYIFNPFRKPLILGQVLYTDAKGLVGTQVQAYDVTNDTLTDPILCFPTARVSAFKDAPSDITTGQVQGIEMVSVIALPTQDLESLRDNRYRLLKESSDLEYVDL